MCHYFRQHCLSVFVLDTFAGKHTAIVLQQLCRSFLFRVLNERARRSQFVLFCRCIIIGNNNKNDNNNSYNDKTPFVLFSCHVYNLYVSPGNNFLTRPKKKKHNTIQKLNVTVIQRRYYVSCVLEFSDRAYLTWRDQIQL